MTMAIPVIKKSTGALKTIDRIANNNGTAATITATFASFGMSFIMDSFNDDYNKISLISAFESPCL